MVPFTTLSGVSELSSASLSTRNSFTINQPDMVQSVSHSTTTAIHKLAEHLQSVLDNHVSKNQAIGKALKKLNHTMKASPVNTEELNTVLNELNTALSSRESEHVDIDPAIKQIVLDAYKTVCKNDPDATTREHLQEMTKLIGQEYNQMFTDEMYKLALHNGHNDDSDDVNGGDDVQDDYKKYLLRDGDEQNPLSGQHFAGNMPIWLVIAAVMFDISNTDDESMLCLANQMQDKKNLAEYITKVSTAFQNAGNLPADPKWTGKPGQEPLWQYYVDIYGTNPPPTDKASNEIREKLQRLMDLLKPYMDSSKAPADMINSAVDALVAHINSISVSLGGMEIPGFSTGSNTDKNQTDYILDATTLGTQGQDLNTTMGSATSANQQLGMIENNMYSGKNAILNMAAKSLQSYGEALQSTVRSS